MNEFELREMLLTVVNSGLGYKAITILTKFLEERANINEMVITEVKATKKATLKFCDADISNKRKVEVIRELWET